jgi:uncharacterized protein
MRVGSVQSIHRYPVKSMGGEDLERSEVGVDGLLGDRAFAVRDEVAGEIRGGKRLPRLMLCSARYRDEPAGARVTHASIAFPEGAPTSTDDPEVARRLSDWLGREVTLHPRAPATDTKHYRRVQPGASIAGVLARSTRLRKAVSRLAMVGPGGRELRDDFGREKDEPLPDLSVFPAEIFEFVSPLGTYFDAYPIHLVTTATLATLRGHDAAGDWDVRRFRPNLVVETGPELSGLVEADWEGRVLRVGDLRLECTVGTPRCSMVIQPQPTLPKDPSVLRTIVREANQCVGIYARVLRGGSLARGAAVELE